MPLDHACGNGRATMRERGLDLYETPPIAVAAMLNVQPVPATVWEPCCGNGNIVRAIGSTGRTVFASDVQAFGPHQDLEIDFLDVERTGCECIVTNPPFYLAQKFVEHARRLVPLTIMLFRLSFMESVRRAHILDVPDLARVLVFAKRLPMMHRDGWEGRKANSGMAFAWFIWDREHNGPTTIERISYA